MSYEFVLKGPLVSLDVTITNEQAADIMHSYMLSAADEEPEEEIEEDVKEAAPAKARVYKLKKPRQCSKCHKAGHIARTCPENQEKVFEQADPLTQQEFDNVKECKQDGLNSKSTAEALGFNSQEVNSAFGSSDYEHYLENRTERDAS